MPELPEVETLRRDLERVIVGRKVKGVDVKVAGAVRRHPDRAEFADRLLGRRVAEVGRRGSTLLLGLDGGGVLAIRLGASGQLLKERTAAPVEQRTDAVITFSTGGDLRVLHLGDDGELFVAAPGDADADPRARSAAIDPLTDAFTWQAFNARLLSRRARLRPLLTDESFVAGIGRIYADEILWVSALRWDRRSDTLTAQEVRRLYRAIREVVQEAVRLRGTSVGDDLHVDLYGNKGEYQSQLSAYQRDGQPCQRCRTPLVCEQLEQVSTFYCPKCQS
ncbi:MAG TPA: bifunctional DNA-formamidopyrimidine glycosylase/DNA-(apurinic or apyrimidinic site) lyase [Actinomycetes bacterium]|nr:bifunctional DNA-formamidopyrimidine glycosylase/DNA-(apurinic or apyrimidinic site) lyase [Actinomycetes bacterium]